MSDYTVEHRLRRFLLIVTGLICVGTVVELWFAEHTESAVQLIPFVLCGLGIGAVLAALTAPQRKVLVALRIVMAAAALSGLYGVYAHLAGNLALEQEIRPGTPAGELFWEALSGGNPLLAPGIMILAASLAIAATYRHPALEATRQS